MFKNIFLKNFVILTVCLLALVFFPQPASAYYNTTNHFYDAETNQQLSNATVFVYNCSNSNCSILGNRIFNQNINYGFQINYSFNNVPYGYAVYFIKEGYLPREINGKNRTDNTLTPPVLFKQYYEGNYVGNVSVKFNKTYLTAIAGIMSSLTISNNNPTPGQQITITANVSSPRADATPNYPEPQELFSYYSAPVNVTLNIYNSTGALIHSSFQQTAPIYQDKTTIVSFTYALPLNLPSGTYTANITTLPNDLACISPQSQTAGVSFTVSCIDADSDGYNTTGGSCGPIDCDDINAEINPGATEICGDGIDNDCDGKTDNQDITTCPSIPYYCDNDGDQYFGSNVNGTCYGTGCAVLIGCQTNPGDDCNDSNYQVNPGATEEYYNGIDDDCNVSTRDCDQDADGFNATNTATNNVCNGNDCNDDNASINPNATDIPDNGIDEDCSGQDSKTITCYADADNDGYTNNTNTTTSSSDIGCPNGYKNTTTDEDCNDLNSSINPGATEICGNNADDNCDGNIDEGCISAKIKSIAITPSTTICKGTSPEIQICVRNTGVSQDWFNVGLTFYAPSDSSKKIDIQSIIITDIPTQQTKCMSFSSDNVNFLIYESENPNYQSNTSLNFNEIGNWKYVVKIWKAAPEDDQNQEPLDNATGSITYKWDNNCSGFCQNNCTDGTKACGLENGQPVILECQQDNSGCLNYIKTQDCSQLQCSPAQIETSCNEANFVNITSSTIPACRAANILVSETNSQLIFEGDANLAACFCKTSEPTTITTHCDDNLFCNGQESCNPTSGCQVNAFTGCDDNISCTLDQCDENAKSCTYIPNNSACNSGFYCNATTNCQLIGTCTTDENCISFSDQCNIGICNTTTWNCQSSPKSAGTNCNDTYFCTENDKCNGAGTCTGTQKICNDNIGCTDDVCNENIGSCVNTANNSLCSAGQVCNKSQGGCFCIYHSAQKCVGNAVYWFDSCDGKQDLNQTCAQAYSESGARFCGNDNNVYQNTTHYPGQNCTLNGSSAYCKTLIAAYFETKKVENCTYDCNNGVCITCVVILTNTSWSDWQNISCLPNDKMNQSRTRTQYDQNNCGEVSNQTFTEYRATEACDYCTEINYYRDADGDGFGNVTNTIFVCDTTAPAGYTTNNTDCNDNDNQIYPGATEICDGIDNNCDGTADNNLTQPSQSCTVGTGACQNTGTQTKTCNGASGWSNFGACSATPGTPTAETCDGIDNDCDGTTDNNLTQPSQSCTVGTGACQNTGTQTKTCNGASGWSNFGACSATPGTPTAEICDNLDNNCNGAIDENLFRSFYTGPAGTEDVGICESGSNKCSAGVWEPYINETIPQEEICDNLDNNCNYIIDEGCDDDGDGYCDSLMTVKLTKEQYMSENTIITLSQKVISISAVSCDNYGGYGGAKITIDDETKIVPSGSRGGYGEEVIFSDGVLVRVKWPIEGSKTADGVGKITVEISTIFTENNSFSEALDSPNVCSIGAGDCNDTVSTINPNATDIPDNGIDENCNGHDNITCYADADNDGYTNNANTTATDTGACPSYYRNTSTTQDCNDTASAINPGVNEFETSALWYNGIDEDCDGIDVNPSVNVLKTGPNNAKVGDNVTYTITVTNNGTVNLTGIVLNDSQINFVQTIGDFNVGNVASFSANHTLQYDDLDANGNFTNVVHVFGDIKHTSSTSTTITSSSSSSFELGNGSWTLQGIKGATIADINLTKEAIYSNPVNVGNEIVYRITISNIANNSNASNISVIDQISENLTIISNASSCKNISGGCNTTTNFCNFTISTLPNKTSCEINITTKVKPNLTQIPINSVNITLNGNTTNVSTNETINVTLPNTIVTKTASCSTGNITNCANASVGDSILYIITLNNTGNGTDKNLTIIDQVSSNLTIVSVSNSSGCIGFTGGCNVITNYCEFNVSQLSNNSACVINITTKVKENATNITANNVSVNSTSGTNQTNQTNGSINVIYVCYYDHDNDTYGNITNTTTQINNFTCPANYTRNNTDCNDYSNTTHPGATEICGNGIDENCDNQDDSCCGDGMCEANKGETCSTCQSDCGSCPVIHTSGGEAYHVKTNIGCEFKGAYSLQQGNYILTSPRATFNFTMQGLNFANISISNASLMRVVDFYEFETNCSTVNSTSSLIADVHPVNISVHGEGVCTITAKPKQGNYNYYGCTLTVKYEKPKPACLFEIINFSVSEVRGGVNISSTEAASKTITSNTTNTTPSGAVVTTTRANATSSDAKTVTSNVTKSIKVCVTAINCTYGNAVIRLNVNQTSNWTFDTTYTNVNVLPGKEVCYSFNVKNYGANDSVANVSVTYSGKTMTKNITLYNEPIAVSTGITGMFLGALSNIWWLLSIIVLGILAWFFFLRKKVTATKVVDENNNVYITVKNKTKADIKNVIIDDELPPNTKASGLSRAGNAKGNMLAWKIPTIKADGGEASVTYKISGEFEESDIPKANVQYDVMGTDKEGKEYVAKTNEIKSNVVIEKPEEVEEVEGREEDEEYKENKEKNSENQNQDEIKEISKEIKDKTKKGGSI